MSINRRHFLQTTGVLSAGFLLHPDRLFASPMLTKVRLGFIGVGMRGQNHLELALRRTDVDVVSICDIDERMLKDSLDMFTKAGKPAPKVYKGDNYAYRKLLDAKDIDAIVIATPWEWHKPMIIDALDRGIKYVGSEVMIGITLQDHWDVVKATEKHKAHVMQLENVCYRRDVMAVMNMVRQGVLGEMIHLQGGYQHDLRGVKFNDGVNPYDSGVEFGEKGFSEARWRTQHSVDRNGDLLMGGSRGGMALVKDGQWQSLPRPSRPVGGRARCEEAARA